MIDLVIPAYVWVALHFFLSTYGIYHALLYKRDSRSALGWTAVCFFVPIFGPLTYFIFGVNRVNSSARWLRKNFLFVPFESAAGSLELQASLPKGIAVAGQRINGRKLSHGNQVRPLYNGEQAYPAMLSAIESASKRIVMATYILKRDETGTAFVSALLDAKARGVEIRVMVDGIGELYSLRKVSKMLTKAGIETIRFLPPRLLPPSVHVNLRNHRKLLIIDDQVAFAGGMNIDNGHTTVRDEPRSINDIHFELRGPVVTELAQVFCHDWTFATGSKDLPLPAEIAKESGDVDCRVVPDGPDEDMDMLALIIQTAISASTQSVDIMTPYFLPSRDLIATLQSAALRGVRVRIVLPQKNNLFYMHWAHRNSLLELLRWNIKVFYQPAPFCHTKLLCIDGNYSLIGSANLDPRSLRLNFELGVEVYSEQLNRELTQHFDQVISASKQTSFTELEERSVPIRLRDSAAALFSPYL